MWIIRTLTTAGLLLGFVLPAPAQASENDSHCVTERNNMGGRPAGSIEEIELCRQWSSD